MLWGLLASCGALALAIAGLLGEAPIYSLKWLKRRGKLGVDAAIRYDYRAADGVIAWDDNRLTVGWAMEGPDFDVSTFSQQAAAVAAGNQALTKRTEEWCVEFHDFSDESSGYNAGNGATDPTSATMLWARVRRYKRRGHTMKHDQFITATFTPPAALVAIFNEWLLDDRLRSKEGDERYDRALREFQEEVDELEHALSSVFKLRRLKTRRVKVRGVERTLDDLAKLLKRAIDGEDIDVVVERPGDVRRVLTAQDFAGGFVPEINGKKIAVVSIEDTPESSVPGLLDALSDVHIPYRRSSKLVFIAREQQAKEARGAYYRQRESSQSFATRLASRGAATNSVVDPGALELAEQARQGLGDVTMQRVQNVRWSTRIVLRDSDVTRLYRNAYEIRKKIRAAGFEARVETWNAAECFVGSLIGDIDHDVSPLQLDTISALDLSPIASSNRGRRINPNPNLPAGSPALVRMLTFGRQEYDFSAIVGDVQHMLLAAPTGSGKSTALNSFVAAVLEQYVGSQVFVFDQGRSAERPCRARGNSFYELDPSNPNGVGFQPLARIDRPSEFLWAVGWVQHDLLKPQGIAPSAPVEKVVREILALLVRAPRRERTITALQHLARAKDPAIAEALEFYTLTGSLGPLLDSDHDDLTTSREQVFEMGTLMRSRDERMIVPVLHYIFHRIEERLGQIVPETGKPAMTVIALDEAPEYLQFEPFSQTVNYWLDKIRKRNGAVWLSTLRFADFMRLPIAHAILDSCKTKIFLPNSEADKAAQQPFYLAAGCTVEDTLRIADPKVMREKRNLLIVQEDVGRAIVNTDIDPVELLFIGRSRPDDIIETARYFERYGRDMALHLLRDAGMHEAAAAWERFAREMQWSSRSREQLSSRPEGESLSA